MHDFDCPYCNAPQEVCTDDGFGMSEDEVFHTNCSKCDKQFIFTTTFSVDHYAQKADCLNDGNHHLIATGTDPFDAWRKMNAGEGE